MNTEKKANRIDTESRFNDWLKNQPENVQAFVMGIKAGEPSIDLMMGLLRESVKDHLSGSDVKQADFWRVYRKMSEAIGADSDGNAHYPVEFIASKLLNPSKRTDLPEMSREEMIKSLSDSLGCNPEVQAIETAINGLGLFGAETLKSAHIALFKSENPRLETCIAGIKKVINHLKSDATEEQGEEEEQPESNVLKMAAADKLATSAARMADASKAKKKPAKKK